MASPESQNDPAWTSAVKTAALSDTGMRRRNNQDSMSVMLAESKAGWDKVGHLFVVADGMGAHAAGELASRLAADLIPLNYTKNQKSVPAEALARSITETNGEIYRRGQANPEFRNMGTTASALAMLPEGAVVAHVGDSRVYRLRGQQLEQLTFDHSLVWEMQASGEVNEETIKSGVIPKNVITRSLGPNPSVQVDLEGPFPLKKGDRFLLCSDGLSGQLSDEEIGVILQQFPPESAVQLMVDLANLRGGPDNITVIISSVEGPSVETDSKSVPPSRGESIFEGFSTILGLISVVCILAAIFLGLAMLWAPAILVAALGLISFGTGLVKRLQATSSNEFSGDRYGRGPHRKFLCKPDQRFVDQLSGTIRALREAANDNSWKLPWEQLDRLVAKGSEAEKSNQMAAAVQGYGYAILEIMKIVREQRNKPADDSEIVDL